MDALRDRWAAQVPGRQIVALLCANTVPMLGAYIGLQAAGHTVLLLSSKIAKSTLDSLTQLYQIGAIVQPGPEDAIVELRTDVTAPDLHPDLSVCLSTSGSTGSPKLVRFTAKQLAENALSIASYLNLTPDEKPLAHLPFEYSFGLSVLHSHMAVGATLLLTEHSVMQKQFWERFEHATSVAGVPFHFEMLLRMRLGRKSLPNLRTLTQAGGRLERKDAEAMHTIATEKGWKFHIMYGQTEAGPRISWLPFDKMASHFDCIGYAIPGVSLERSSEGNLVVNSPSIMMGYAETADDLSKGDQMAGKLMTGDLVEEPELGLFRIIGRKNRFIKLQGNRVSLSDVEIKLGELGFPVCCSGEDDTLVVFTEQSDTDIIRSTAIGLFSFPTRSLKVVHIEAFPRRSNEKIDYAALQLLAQEEI
ncbi:AMP-binding protein [Aliiroseovarius lamellibrachiae]|uniref:AMP-binding protein n=1 Tax=Aliiroseovarius lamellibrachiae TaxID=1924933 RepID=UPI001BE0DA61|nr:AMP-binding protein [Aliiroseovarius lamellibrachiae]